MNTKFDLGDTVFYLSYNKVASDVIVGVIVTQHKDAKTREQYLLESISRNMGPGPRTYHEGEQLHKSREELIKSL